MGYRKDTDTDVVGLFSYKMNLVKGAWL